MNFVIRINMLYNSIIFILLGVYFHNTDYFSSF